MDSFHWLSEIQVNQSGVSISDFFVNSAGKIGQLTKTVMMDIDPYNADNSNNYVFLSAVPDVCKSQPCVLGIDEAGRGPVLGPMVYGIAYCPIAWNDDLKALGVDDSKALKEEQREELLGKIESANEHLGYAVHILAPR